MFQNVNMTVVRKKIETCILIHSKGKIYWERKYIGQDWENVLEESGEGTIFLVNDDK